MFLVKKATKPLGIGSIVRVSNEKLDVYNKKKSGAVDNRLSGKIYIVIGKVNSCKENTLKVLNIYTGSSQAYNTRYFFSNTRDNITFLSLSAVEDTKQSYALIFGEEGRRDVQENILKVHGVIISKL